MTSLQVLVKWALYQTCCNNLWGINSYITLDGFDCDTRIIPHEPWKYRMSLQDECGIFMASAVYILVFRHRATFHALHRMWSAVSKYLARSVLKLSGIDKLHNNVTYLVQNIWNIVLYIIGGEKRTFSAIMNHYTEVDYIKYIVFVRNEIVGFCCEWDWGV